MTVGKVTDIISLLIKGYIVGRHNMSVHIGSYFKRVCDLYLFCDSRESNRDYYLLINQSNEKE